MRRSEAFQRAVFEWLSASEELGAAGVTVVDYELQGEDGIAGSGLPVVEIGDYILNEIGHGVQRVNFRVHVKMRPGASSLEGRALQDDLRDLLHGRFREISIGLGRLDLLIRQKSSYDGRKAHGVCDYLAILDFG